MFNAVDLRSYGRSYESNDAAYCHGGNIAGFYLCTSAHGWLWRGRRCRDDCAQVGAVGQRAIARSMEYDGMKMIIACFFLL
jgi:hypothetical protein